MATDTNLGGTAQQQNRPRVADGSPVKAWFGRDGSLISTDIANGWALEGRIFTVNYGQGATSVTGQTSITAGKPDFNLDVPQGTAIIPLFVGSVWTASAGTVTHQIVQYQQNTTGNGTSSAATAGPLWNRTDHPMGSNCTARQAYSVAGTTAVNPVELADWFYAFADATGNPPKLWSWYADLTAPIILIGPASISGYTIATTSAPNFKAVLSYAEFATGQI